MPSSVRMVPTGGWAGVMASWVRLVLNSSTTAGWTFAASAALGLTFWDQLLLSLLVATATFAMYAYDYISGAMDGADDGAKPERIACIRAHANAMRASIQAAMLVCTAALLALRPVLPSLSVVAVGMVLGFAYNASWLPGQLAPKKAFTGAKVAYVALMWALGCVALPYTVKTHRAVTTAAAVAAAGDVYLDLQLHAKGLAAGFGNSNAVVDSAPLSMLLLYLGVAAFTAAAAHNADVPDIKADRAAGVKTIAAAVGHGNAVLVSVALAAVGTLAGLATGCVWLAGVGPLALSATFATAAGWHDAGIMLDDLQGMLAGLLAALLV